MALHTVGRRGEAGVISRFLAQRTYCAAALVDAGDDAFVSAPLRGRRLVVTTDALVEGVHFDPRWMSWRQIGRKALLVNVSDCAAMGAVAPRSAFVTVALPRGFPARDSDALARGVRDSADRFRIHIAGGDTVGSPGGVFLSITLIGYAQGADIITRSGARPGDLLYIDGLPGRAVLGMRLLAEPRLRKTISPATARLLISCHQEPEPRLAAGRRLAGERLASALMDSSDGLSASVRALCAASRVGALVTLDAVMDTALMRTLSRARGLDPLTAALVGGEDYSLVFTVPPGRERRLRRSLPGAICLGRVTAGRAVRFSCNGRRLRLPEGFRHF